MAHAWLALAILLAGCAAHPGDGAPGSLESRQTYHFLFARRIAAGEPQPDHVQDLAKDRLRQEPLLWSAYVALQESASPDWDRPLEVHEVETVLAEVRSIQGLAPSGTWPEDRVVRVRVSGAAQAYTLGIAVAAE